MWLEGWRKRGPFGTANERFRRQLMTKQGAGAAASQICVGPAIPNQIGSSVFLGRAAILK